MSDGMFVSASPAEFILVFFGACLLLIAFGMWSSIRKYPAPELPTDGTEGGIVVGLAVAGALLIGLGVMQ